MDADQARSLLAQTEKRDDTELVTFANVISYAFIGNFLGSTQNLQFRWEIFNVINKVNYNAPVTALNSASFGQIQSAGDPRIMQFALKVDF
jgi:hypothetical protein